VAHARAQRVGRLALPARDLTRFLPEHEQGRGVIGLLHRLPILYSSWDDIVDRVWELRHNLTSTDAAYVALAEAADATLLTKDRRLAAEPGSRCTVEVLP